MRTDEDEEDDDNVRIKRETLKNAERSISNNKRETDSEEPSEVEVEMSDRHRNHADDKSAEGNYSEFIKSLAAKYQGKSGLVSSNLDRYNGMSLCTISYLQF